MSEDRSDADRHRGAVKSNIGHLEGASGLVGIIKTVMIPERGIIPPSTNFEILDPSIDSEYLKIEVCRRLKSANALKFPLKATPWPAPGLRRASFNSFSFGSANYHTILNDACHYLRCRSLTGRHRSVEYPRAIDAITDDSSDMKPDASVNGYAYLPA